MNRKGTQFFPFAAIVGQEEMKRALILNVIDPGIGGLLIRGEKGTAKSTTVRALAQVLPPITHAAGCPFRCRPGNTDAMCVYCREKIENGETLEWTESPMRVVELPLSATEDRITGTLDLEHVLKTGKKKFEPGVLAQANGNILYVDEVNLLEDHIVDLLLDSAAMGVNYVEREGVSFSHPSRFVLVGSMNPEEGELRPQLLDRFGLSVEIKGVKDHDLRNEIVMRKLAYEDDPEGYTEKYREETEALAHRIENARNTLSRVTVDEDSVSLATGVALEFGMEGHRADIAIIRASRANAAFEGRTEITKDDIRMVAPMVLSHRVKRKPFEKTEFDREALAECLERL